MRKPVLQTIEGVRKKKELFMRFLVKAQKQVEGHEKVINDCDRLTACIIEKKKRRLRFFPALMVLLCLCLALGGCTASLGSSATFSAFYPKKWESPESRKQHTQPTVGMARNNFELPMIGRGQ